MNPIRPRYAKERVASLPKTVKPAIGRVATSTSTGRTLRGGWGQRAANDLSGTWETRPEGPNKANDSRERITGSRSGSGVGGVHSSVEAE
jgi:hypothetical protein